jgi:hypothetical protein
MNFTFVYFSHSEFMRLSDCMRVRCKFEKSGNGKKFHFEKKSLIAYCALNNFFKNILILENKSFECLDYGN